MKALVTGASGFIGSHLVEALRERGDDVRALVRSRDRLRWIAGRNDVELCQGSLEDSGSLGRAVDGVDVVFHTAGVVKARRVRTFFDVNSDGTRRLLAAVMNHAPAVKRFVFVSSQAAAGPGAQGRPIDEDAPPRPVSPYGASKLRAEELLLEQRANLPVTIVRPPAVFGPRDSEVYVYFRLARRGFVPIPGFGRRRLSVVYVDDLVQGLLLAGTREEAVGRTFFLTTGDYDWREIAAALKSAVGRGMRVPVPAWFLYAGGAVSQAFGWLFRRDVALNISKAREMTQRSWLCSDRRARELLGYAPQATLADAMRATAAWYRSEGWL